MVVRLSLRGLYFQLIEVLAPQFHIASLDACMPSFSKCQAMNHVFGIMVDISGIFTFFLVHVASSFTDARWAKNAPTDSRIS